MNQNLVEKARRFLGEDVEQLAEATAPEDEEFSAAVATFLMGDRDDALRRLTKMKDTLPLLEISTDVAYNKTFNEVYSGFYDLMRKIRSEYGSEEG